MEKVIQLTLTHFQAWNLITLTSLLRYIQCFVRPYLIKCNPCTGQAIKEEPYATLNNISKWEGLKIWQVTESYIFFLTIHILKNNLYLRVILSHTSLGPHALYLHLLLNMNLHFIRLRLGQNNTRMCYGKEECGMRLQTWKLEAQECSGNLRAKIDQNIGEGEAIIEVSQ